MNRIAKTFAPLVVSVAAAVACTAASVALLAPAPAQAQSTDRAKADFARGWKLTSSGGPKSSVATSVPPEMSRVALQSAAVLQTTVRADPPAAAPDAPPHQA